MPFVVVSQNAEWFRWVAVLYFSVSDPVMAVVNVMDFGQATTQIGQTTLRNVLGQSELDELLTERDKINQRLQGIIEEQTARWCIKMSDWTATDPRIGKGT